MYQQATSLIRPRQRTGWGSGNADRWRFFRRNAMPSVAHHQRPEHLVLRARRIGAGDAHAAHLAVEQVLVMRAGVAPAGDGGSGVRADFDFVRSRPVRLMLSPIVFKPEPAGASSPLWEGITRQQRDGPLSPWRAPHRNRLPSGPRCGCRPQCGGAPWCGRRSTGWRA